MQPSSEYISLSEQPSKTTTEKQDQLIILDLNGTLCSRTKARTTYYLRPHAKRFFDYIFQNYTVMVWSSAQTKSVNSMCKMFLPYKPGLTWDRSHFNLSKEEFYSNSKTQKDLNLVWEISDDFNATNTIIIDDTSRKVSAQPYNLMLMSTFDHTTHTPSSVDNDLLKAIAYLKNLRYQTNVANYMKNQPFDLKFDYEIEEVEPHLTSYIGHYVNGVLVNPPDGVPKVEKMNKKQKKRNELAMNSKLPPIVKPSINNSQSEDNNVIPILTPNKIKKRPRGKRGRRSKNKVKI